jgi:hypothetical protein
VWGLWKNSFERIEESSIDKTKPVVAVEFKDARMQSSIPDFQKKALDIIKSNKMNVTIIAVKEGTKIPSYAMKIEDFIASEFERLNTVKFVEDKMLADIKNQMKKISYYDIIKLMYKMRWKTSKPSVWNDAVDALENIETITNAVKEDTVSSEYIILTEISKLLGIPLKTSKGEVFSFDKIRESVYNTYGMLKYVDLGANRDDIIRYVEMVGV